MPCEAFVGFLAPRHNVVNTSIRKIIVPTKLQKIKSVNDFPTWRHNQKGFGFVLAQPFGVETLYSSFLSAVPHIITMSTNEKVVRVDTGGSVASVANTEGLIKSSFEMFIRNTMRHFARMVLLSTKLHNSVTKLVFPTLPNPARSFFKGMPFNSLLNRYFFNHNNPYIGKAWTWQV